MSNCRTTGKSIACYTAPDGTKSNLFAHTVYDANGANMAEYYVDAQGVVIAPDLTNGVLTPGQCPVYAPDVEWQKLCDVQADGTAVPFMCRTVTSFTPDGAVIDPVVATNFALDKVTAYVVTGTVGECDTCPDEAALGLITDLSALA